MATSIRPFYRRDLCEIALITIELLKRNRSLQARLQQLKMETRQFVASVMSNPENERFRDDSEQNNNCHCQQSPVKVFPLRN